MQKGHSGGLRTKKDIRNIIMSEVNPRKRLAVDSVVLDSMLTEYMTSEGLVDSSASNSTPQAIDTLQSHHYVDASFPCASFLRKVPRPPPSM